MTLRITLMSSRLSANFYTRESQPVFILTKIEYFVEGTSSKVRF